MANAIGSAVHAQGSHARVISCTWCDMVGFVCKYLNLLVCLVNVPATWTKPSVTDKILTGPESTVLRLSMPAFAELLLPGITLFMKGRSPDPCDNGLNLGDSCTQATGLQQPSRTAVVEARA